MPIQLKQFKVIAIDADDTLWDCQSHFDNAEAVYCQLLAAYAGAKHVSDALFETEKANMDSLGYGTKAFTLSLIENAVKISEGRISGKIIAERPMKAIDLWCSRKANCKTKRINSSGRDWQTTLTISSLCQTKPKKSTDIYA